MDLQVGSIVRVPLGNRRVRGMVVGLRREEKAQLKDVAAVSGDLPVFDKRLLETLRWAALHYVAPLSVVLGKTAPPNLPRLRSLEAPRRSDSKVSSALARGVADGSRIQPAHVASAPSSAAVTDLVAAAGERSALVIVPTVAEGRLVADYLARSLGDGVAAAWSSMPAAEVTESWSAFATGVRPVLVGTREAVWWPAPKLAVAVVLGEGRRGMKDKQTPTTHVRDVIRRRGAVERFPVVSFGEVPTAETVAAGVELIMPAGRAWPVTELVDRTEDPPGRGALSERVRSAMRSLIGRSGTAFVLCRSRGEAVRCARCRELRLCRACGSSIGRSAECSRCATPAADCGNCGGKRFEAAFASIPRVVEELRGVVGSAAGGPDSGAQIVVGTERDVPPPGTVDVAVAVDPDSLLFAPNYRAAEDGLRLLARVARTVGRGRGNRAIVQTAHPSHPVYEALRRGNAVDFLRRELAARSGDGLPPLSQLMAVEVEGGPDTVAGDLASAAADGVRLLGPAIDGDKRRWLVQGADLRRVKAALRTVVQAWREAGARVRIDADPIEL